MQRWHATGQSTKTVLQEKIPEWRLCLKAGARVAYFVDGAVIIEQPQVVGASHQTRFPAMLGMWEYRSIP